MTVPFPASPPGVAAGAPATASGTLLHPPANRASQSQQAQPPPPPPPPPFDRLRPSTTTSPAPDDAAPAVLTFADVPSDLARLSFSQRENRNHNSASIAAKPVPPPPPPPPPPQQQQPGLLTPSPSPSRSLRRVSFAPAAAAAPSFSLSPSPPDSLSVATHLPLEPGRPRVSSSASTASAASSAPSTPVLVHPPQPRKPSPGLAARLKALGFGAAPRKDAPPPSVHQPERIGRLPEDQLRQIDQKHQAGSSVLVIERRGRPWKGASAVVPGLTSGRSKPSDADADADADDDDTDADADADADAAKDADTDAGSTVLSPPALVVVTEPGDQQSVGTATASSVTSGAASSSSPASPSPASSFLPEIEPALPLEMDTNKFRLPDHANGNGTKVQLETRRQHLERNPSTATLTLACPDEVPPPPLPKDSPPLVPQQQQKQGREDPHAPTTPPPQQQQQQQQQQSDFRSDFTPDAASYFNPLGLQRPGSIYTLSRVSFANQLAQLTSLQLPDAESLSSRVAAIPTAQAAARALIGAAEQIRNWISKASEVIDGLDSDDDVEWAAAGGREGLEEVENAILRFEELINVYVGAIEALQNRPDIATVTPDDLQRAVVQMESIMDEWRRMRTALQSVKAQVEIAMEWEELWGMVLGDIQNEMDDLSRLVFEMEERRHRSMASAGAGVDIGDLETIVEESKKQKQQQQQQSPQSAAATRTTAANNRYSIPIFPTSPLSPDAATATAAPTAAGATGAAARASMPSISQDDSSLLALFARMQPMRASLDFLPMRLSVFETRASSCFPTACEELEMRRAGLDSCYKKLEKDAENLRKELGEDRWVTVFRGAARQAQKMYESVERSVAKLKEALDTGLYLTNQPSMAKKMESYETKKTHYGPAIERVLAIIDKGIKDRLTLNGEILRLHAELQAQWDALRDRMHDLDLALEELHASDRRNEQLRDSISSMLSNDRSTVGSGHDTPQSSPPSSVIMSTLGLEGSGTGHNRRTAAAADTKHPPNSAGNRRRSLMSSHLPQPASRRSSSSSPTAAAAAQARKPLSSRHASSLGPGSSYAGGGGGAGSSLSSPNREGSLTPVGKQTAARTPRSSSTIEGRPRWSFSTTGIDTGHNFKPLTLTTPSPYAKTTPSPTTNSLRRAGPSISGTPRSTSSLGTRLPMRSPLGRTAASSDAPPPPQPPAGEGAAGTPSRNPAGFSDAPLYRPPRPPRLAAHASAPPSASANRRASLQPPQPHNGGGSPSPAPRPASSLATSRRSSLLPAPRRRESSVSGRESPQALAGARAAMRSKAPEPKPNDKPRWRP